MEEEEEEEEEIKNNPPIPILDVSGELLFGTEDIGYIFDISDELHFSTSTSFDPDGRITKYTLDIGINNIIRDTEAIEFSHKYSYPGCFNITLEVEDDDGLKNKTYMEILVVEEWGLWAEYFITDNVYKDILIEIDYFGEIKPYDNSIEFLKTRINRRRHDGRSQSF